jgi:hypothetical protein
LLAGGGLDAGLGLGFCCATSNAGSATAATTINRVIATPLSMPNP